VPARDSLQRATAYLAFHFDRDIALSWLAENVAFTSAGNLSRLFRRAHGFSFQAYLQRLRLRKAAELLEHSRLPVRRIARCVGYDDPSRFAEHFRRAAGLTPLRYRKDACRRETIPNAPAP
jgi:transcriptional regulator GlxA family with amidase domain